MELEAGRHLCQEARVVLTSLRGGPPLVARGDLAQDLMDLRRFVKRSLNARTSSISTVGAATPSMLSMTSIGGVGDDSGGPNSPLKFEPPTNLDPPLPPDVGSFARPFLAVVMDPRAAGPHTLVALRALHRLLERKSLQVAPHGSSRRNAPHMFTVALEPLTKGVLNCKFEQTDAGSDEAVEMAIADLIALIVQLDRRAIRTDTLMDAFNTVFVTRNTFVHSPALCYHFEDVLSSMCQTVFFSLDNLKDPAGRMILEFLVNQLLHTPLVGGEDEASREAQMAHDATRVLCLRLTRTALKAAFDDADWSNDDMLDATSSHNTSPDTNEQDVRTILQIVQDDLSLALLMTGQAVWAYQENANVSPGFISLEVLAEICSTLSSLWTSISLRRHLVAQFEAIFSGFYQRALVLLRKCRTPVDNAMFHANMYLDAGVEIILESLVDVMTMHDHRQTVAQGNGGSLETLFAFYDCNIKQSDVAVGLMLELCRCTGCKVDEDGFEQSLDEPPTDPVEKDTAGQPDTDDFDESITSFRPVPSHLRELCAEAIIGGMKCLFQDDHASDETKAERHSRQSIMAGHVSPAPSSWSDLNRVTSSHHLRNIKSKKRLMRKAAQLFNEKAGKGIEFLLSAGVIESPVTPRAVASFLRNGIVVGLDKKAVGMYLGEIGKSSQENSSKAPPIWQMDWFHKEVLEIYCNLFRFERQSLLDGLRMFLAAFRLPGESQQIDRILQAFSDCCSRVCEEGPSGPLKLFSDDPKRASDAAYLLSFSIIMLNTDQHNDNIREDRKMSKADFVKNNTDYGSDITDKGKALPREYLEGIYDSIRLEEIRTEGEGADGMMTVERWKDVLRGSAEESHSDDLPSIHDAEDLTELVLEHVWMPIMSSVSALWGVDTPESPFIPNGSLGPQGARLGMDMAWDMLVGVRQLGRNDIFRKIFSSVCEFSGLLDYGTDVHSRGIRFATSAEKQGALVVAIRIAREATDEVGVDGWRQLWLMLLELRDLQLLGIGNGKPSESLLCESEPDLLRVEARRLWTSKLLGRGFDHGTPSKKSSGVSSMFGAMGRALFGSGDLPEPEKYTMHTVHGKENHLIWDESLPLINAAENDTDFDDPTAVFAMHGEGVASIGSQFEALLLQEDLFLSQQREMPVTGLERVEDPNGMNIRARTRVRSRLAKSCDFAGLVSESRFLDDNTIQDYIQSLLGLFPDNTAPDDAQKPPPISPASEAFTEVLIAEIALRNRDRLASLWQSHLKLHYEKRLRMIIATNTVIERAQFKLISGAMEKSLTGLLRIASCAVQRGDFCNDILESFALLNGVETEEGNVPLVNSFDRHLGEGLLRIVRGIDDSSSLNDRGWNGLFSLLEWCANRGYSLPPVHPGTNPVGLVEDDPSLKVYRSLHFLLNLSDVKDDVPHSAVKYIRMLMATGEVRNCPKLSVAAIDLLHVFCGSIESAALAFYRECKNEDEKSQYWGDKWVPVLESMAEACASSSVSSVRQHALSVLTDTFLENDGSLIPVSQVSAALANLCIPLARDRILELRATTDFDEDYKDLQTEMELCVSLLFKPLRHHIKNVLNEGVDALQMLWTPILGILQEIFADAQIETSENGDESNDTLQSNELALEHLRNVVMVLISYDILQAEPNAEDDISASTWKAISNIPYCSAHVEEWKQAASK
eukprot:Nitzschia sp. Nitz4//scaffold170_size48074//15496//20557//NITZ4_007104-RA/size48074-snap-gene-0.36-mRNA-1//1//CDS//3329538637//778//frame0